MNPLEARRRLLGRNVYKRTTEGNPAIAQGSLARRYPGITMQGWTEQDSTTGAQLFDKTKIEDRVDTTHTETDTGVEVSGLYYVVHRVSVTPNTDMYISYNKSGEGLNQVSVYGTDISADNFISSSYGKGMKFNTGNHTEILVLFYSSAGTENVSIYNDVMLNLGATALPYEPYTGDAPSPSPEYPQEIVSAGKYNEDTQKWDYEITIANAQTDPDKNQTVTLTADRPLTKWDKLEKRNGQWGWVYKSMEITLDGSDDEAWELYDNGFYISGGLKDIALDEPLLSGSLSDKFHYSSPADHATFSITSTLGSYSPLFYYSGIADVESWKKFLTENNVSFLYPTEAETFVSLSETEQEVMNALYTFRPTTVLSNDCDCNMSLTYKTKKSMGGG